MYIYNICTLLFIEIVAKKNVAPTPGSQSVVHDTHMSGIHNALDIIHTTDQLKCSYSHMNTDLTKIQNN